MDTPRSTKAVAQIAFDDFRSKPLAGDMEKNMRPSVLRQRKSSYFKSWERNLTTSEGATQAVPVTPIVSAIVQQDLTTIPQAMVRGVMETRELKEDDEKAPIEPEYTEGIKLCLMVLALALAVFLVALDETIITTAIPTISRQFASPDDVGWYAAAYLVSSSGFRLFYGKLYSVLSIKVVLLAAIVWFEVGSLLSGLAPSSGALIAGRFLSGIGSAGIGTGFSVVLAHTVPPRKLAFLTSIVNSVYGVASVVAPLIGGGLTTRLSWRWCFLINLPLGTTAGIATLFFLRVKERPKVPIDNLAGWIRRFDLLGLSVFLPGMVILLVALQWGGTKYHWNDPRIVIMLITAAALLSMFIYIQYKSPMSATIPARIAKQRSVACGALCSFSLGAGATVIEYYLPMWFQIIKGVSPLAAGYMMLPTILGFTLFSLSAGFAISLLGYYVPFMIAGSVFLALGSGLLTTISRKSGTAAWICYQILVGAGGGFGGEQPYIAAMSALPLEDVPSGVAFVSFTQALGSTLSITLAQSIFSAVRSSHLAAAAGTSFKPGFGSSPSLQTDLDGEDSALLVAINNAAITRTFFIAVAAGSLAMIGALGMEWISLRKLKQEDTT